MKEDIMDMIAILLAEQDTIIDKRFLKLEDKINKLLDDIQKRENYNYEN